MIFKDYYKILGLDTKDVTPEQVKVAYREQAKKYHPDVNVGNKNAEERFKDINEAYMVLSNAASKKKYDRMWNNYVRKRKLKYEQSKKEKTSVFNDFFNIFFGTVGEKKVEVSGTTQEEGKIPIKGENIETEIDISIRDAFYGSYKRISMKFVGGNTKDFDVKIPAGIQNKEKIKLAGQGRKGENGGKNGDLIIKINIKDDQSLKLVGNDLFEYLPITPWEAALGTKVTISGLDEDVKIIVPKGTQSGEQLRISGKGYKNEKGGRGDLVAEVKIMVPTNLSEKEVTLFKGLEQASHFDPRTMVG